ncbi:hypothetical protein E4T50_01395 [Aureobasidium sp. EXF-12298]|nr:hypothetical protein E4T50_01395 [Aureobasidium sp. EXF-12298]KAI4766124.1 hypothetical protein E4T51_00959 [Aureobasidium sp. EXF-12344]KAI4783584.1 hypothetical protein E4T52_01493 [Aureobasidium sp. EXF-3400]
MPLTDASRESFMFVKCTGKTSVGKIRDSYLSREEAPSDISLHLGFSIPPLTAKVSELDQFGDKVVVFYARSVDPDNTTSATVPAITSAPLNPQFTSGSTENGHFGAPSTGVPTPAARQSSASSGLSADHSAQFTASSALSLSAPKPRSSHAFLPNGNHYGLATTQPDNTHLEIKSEVPLLAPLPLQPIKDFEMGNTNSVPPKEDAYDDAPYEDESSKYRAEIKFIKPAEWEKELRVLFEEIIDGSGNISREHYVDSKEKPELTKDLDDEDEDEDISKGTGEKDRKKKKTRKREQEFWPLIKVIRLYVKADALSTSAVLVDLPGVADSNAARAAVAEGYMKQCIGLWIVSPINRAVDDKAAKNLLGSAFRRQLKFDGTYSAITFICKAADSLGLGDEFKELKEQLTSIERRRRAVEKESKKLDDGKTVYALAAKTKKRKRSSSESDKLKTQKKEARRRRSEIEAEVTDLNNKIKELKVEARNIEDNRSRICIDARNQYSKSAIQVDFAAGIKELDQETAADEDPDTFNPEEDLRDYEKVAKDLPVYCVSSRAYQKLSGRLVKDNAVRGFTDVEQTEDLEKDVQDTLTEIKETLNENIFENYGTAINAAANAALPTS